jgi:hypothetical protein
MGLGLDFGNARVTKKCRVRAIVSKEIKSPMGILFRRNLFEKIGTGAGG